jgi:hypothetical protein
VISMPFSKVVCGLSASLIFFRAFTYSVMVTGDEIAIKNFTAYY